jgi:hypothetical protein
MTSDIPTGLVFALLYLDVSGCGEMSFSLPASLNPSRPHYTTLAFLRLFRLRVPDENAIIIYDLAYDNSVHLLSISIPFLILLCNIGYILLLVTHTKNGESK